MIRAIKKTSPALILSIIIIFHLINTFIWLKMDNSSFTLDAWRHYRHSLVAYYDVLKNIAHLNVSLTAIKPIHWHTGLVAFATATLYFVFDRAKDTAVMVNSSIFLIILVLSTYGIGKKIFNRNAGILAAFIVTMYPVIFINLRIYMPDLPLTAMVALSLYFLTASNNFADKINSLFFAASLMLGFLVKFSYGAFIIGPFIIACYNALGKKNSSRKINFLCLAIIAVFLGAVFYVSKYTDFFHRALQASYLDILKDEDFSLSDLLSLKFSWMFTSVKIFLEQGLSFILFTTLLMGVWFFRKLKLENRWSIYLAVIIPLFIQVFFFLIPWEDTLRHSMPFLPVTAIISGVGIASLKSARIKKFSIALLILFSTAQFLAISYGIPPLPPFFQSKTAHPALKNWKGTKILEIIRRTNPSGQRVKVVFLRDVPETFEAMAYEITLNKECIDLINAASRYPEDSDENSRDAESGDADYIICSDTARSPLELYWNSDILRTRRLIRAQNAFSDNIGKYKLMFAEHLPDDSKLLIYKNIYKSTIIKSWEIQQDNTRFAFDNGRGRIFYKNLEITKGLGLYTSLFAAQYWRDSMEASWEVKKLGTTKLIAKGQWLCIPVSEVWEIELKPGNVIDWQVEMEVRDKIEIKMEDFKLMLSDKYKEWLVSTGENGLFSDYFEKDQWKRFWAGSIETKVAIKSTYFNNISLPGVEFHVYQTPPRTFTSIENSDQLFNGRVIGCFKTNSSTNILFSPGRYKYFSAEISLK